MICRPPEWQQNPFVCAYMVPRLSDECLKIGLWMLKGVGGRLMGCVCGRCLWEVLLVGGVISGR